MEMLQKVCTAQEKTQEATSAISCFQKALRDNINDSACWEALGDAYMARGSYMSALKTFQKAAELNSGSIYPVYQIAAIKQLLGEYRQAVEAYENLLIHSPDYVPALKGPFTPLLKIQTSLMLYLFHSLLLLLLLVFFNFPDPNK